MKDLFQALRGPASAGFAGASLVFGAIILAGCVAPIGVERVTMRQAYGQVEANVFRTGKPSASTVAILHRFDLDRLAARQPDEAVCKLHQMAVANGERDLLFALAELSYVAGDRIGRSVKPWDPRDARDYYLGSAVYAWLFLFGEGKDAPPSVLDRRVREACNFYNYGLGLSLLERKSTNGAVQLRSARRRLPVGELELQLSPTNFLSQLETFDEILLADQFRMRGMSVRNRNPGVGTPLLCVRPLHPEFGVRQCTPATVVLRGPVSLAELGSGKLAGSLEVYSIFDDATISIGGAKVPLEFDLTTFRAYTLSQSRIWRVGNLQFLAPAKRIRSQLIPNQPFEPDKIPVVFVHGTFSSPVTWAEMVNTLTADPFLRQRYQIWSFNYGSGNPLLYSVADLRSVLTAEIQRLDPEGTNAVLRQMVIIGHSQGGLLAKGTAMNTGNLIWQQFSTNRFEDLNINEMQRAALRRLLFPEPLPFVKRIVFIATPHRGSYLARGFARRLAQRLVSLPGSMVSRGTDLLRLTSGSDAGRFFHGKMPTSLDGMSPKNPGLLAMAEIPIVPSVKAHSIIPVLCDGDYRQGRDSVVAYQSAHVDYVKSEFIVRSKHSCLNQPATIEEVRRILHEHLDDL
jgi:pimeloyl-ACP methyl ester carboxylesterase